MRDDAPCASHGTPRPSVLFTRHVNAAGCGVRRRTLADDWLRWLAGWWCLKFAALRPLGLRGLRWRYSFVWVGRCVPVYRFFFVVAVHRERAGSGVASLGLWAENLWVHDRMRRDVDFVKGSRRNREEEFDRRSNQIIPMVKEIQLTKRLSGMITF